MPVWRNGRRARLKIAFRKEWGFESLHGHQFRPSGITPHDAKRHQGASRPLLVEAMIGPLARTIIAAVALFCIASAPAAAQSVIEPNSGGQLARDGVSYVEQPDGGLMIMLFARLLRGHTSSIHSQVLSASRISADQLKWPASELQPKPGADQGPSLEDASAGAPRHRRRIGIARGDALPRAGSSLIQPVRDRQSNGTLSVGLGLAGV